MPTPLQKYCFECRRDIKIQTERGFWQHRRKCVRKKAELEEKNAQQLRPRRRILQNSQLAPEQSTPEQSTSVREQIYLTYNTHAVITAGTT